MTFFIRLENLLMTLWALCGANSKMLKIVMTLELHSDWIWPMTWLILRAAGLCGLYTHLWHDHKKNAQGKVLLYFQSHDFGNQLTSRARRVTMPSNLSCRISNMSQKCDMYCRPFETICCSSNTEQKKLIIIDH